MDCWEWGAFAEWQTNITCYGVDFTDYLQREFGEPRADDRRED